MLGLGFRLKVFGVLLLDIHNLVTLTLTGVEAHGVVELADIAADGDAGAGSAVVRPLRPRESALRPPQRPLGLCIKQRVLLLQPKPDIKGGDIWIRPPIYAKYEPHQ